MLVKGADNLISVHIFNILGEAVVKAEGTKGSDYVNVREQYDYIVTKKNDIAKCDLTVGKWEVLTIEGISNAWGASFLRGTLVYIYNKHKVSLLYLEKSKAYSIPDRDGIIEITKKVKKVEPKVIEPVATEEVKKVKKVKKGNHK